MANIDSHIKNQLENYQAPYDSNDWAKMEAMLDDKRKRPIIPLWFFGCGLIVLLSIGTIGFFFVKNLNKSDNTAIVESTGDKKTKAKTELLESTNKRINEDTRQEVRKFSEPSEKKSQQNSISPKQNEKKDQKPKQKKVVENKSSKASQANRKSAVSLESPSYSSRPKTPIYSPVIAPEKTSIYTSNSVQSSTAYISSSASSPINIIPEQATKLVLPSINKSASETKVELIAGPVINNDKAAALNKDKKASFLESTFLKKLSMLTNNFGAVRAYEELDKAEVDLKTLYTLPKEPLNERKNLWYMGLQYEHLFALPIDKIKFGQKINGGIQFGIISKNRHHDISTGLLFEDQRTRSAADLACPSDSLINVVIRGNSQSVALPLNYSYVFNPDAKFKFKAGLGMKVNYLISGSYNYRFDRVISSTSVIDAELVGDTIDIGLNFGGTDSILSSADQTNNVDPNVQLEQFVVKRFNFSPLIHAGFDFDLSKRVSINALAKYEFSLLKHNIDPLDLLCETPKSQRVHNLGLNLSLRYSF